MSGIRLGAAMLLALAATAQADGLDETETVIRTALEARARERESAEQNQATEHQHARHRVLARARADEHDRLVAELLHEADEESRGLAADPRVDFTLDLHPASSDVLLGALQDAESDDSAGVDQGDKTGTNPIAFTFDLRLYNEHQWLNTAGDGDQNVTTLEFRAPLLDGKLQFRVKARVIDIDADLNGDGVADADDSGFGDTDLRFLVVPHVDMANKFAFAVGLEIFLDTASEDVLGAGSTALGPQVFAVFFKPFDSPYIDLFAPAYQHRFSVDGNDVNQSLIDLFFLKTAKDKSWWMLLDPQFILDHETGKDFILIDAEFGLMVGAPGHSIYVRPSVGIGGDRPYDASFEAGYKIIW